LAYRFTNQNNPAKTIRVSSPTWFGILDMAEEQGWNPLGTVHPEGWLFPGRPMSGPGLEFREMLAGSYIGEEIRLVLIEDALNLADALVQASLAYEPIWTRFEAFEEAALAEASRRGRGAIPSLGAILYMEAFCRLGAFSIEKE